VSAEWSVTKLACDALFYRWTELEQDPNGEPPTLKDAWDAAWEAALAWRRETHDV